MHLRKSITVSLMMLSLVAIMSGFGTAPGPRPQAADPTYQIDSGHSHTA